MPLSVLVAGPHFAQAAGGLERAIADLVAGLRAQGIDVDDATGASIAPEARSTVPVAPASWLSALNGSSTAAALWGRLAPRRRRSLRDLFTPRGEIAAADAALSDLERRLASRRYDAVLYCVEEAPPGGLALAQDRHRCVVPVAIEGLAAELEGGAISGRILRARGVHRWLGRRADPAKIHCAILSSRSWAGATVRAGLASAIVHPVYFGVPVPAVVRPARAYEGRLLYVGRLVKEKGLHILLEGVARACERDPRVRLTLVGGEGPRAYRELVRRRIDALGLAGIVDWRPPVPRAALAQLFAHHDALLFWSRLPESAPLVTMEAMAAQLPVVVPSPLTPSPFYEDGATCVTYDRFDRESLAAAIERLGTDPALVARVAAEGAARIRDGFTPEHTARQYAALLREAVAR